MANRILIGPHPNYGQGFYVSKAGVDVTGANLSDFLFTSSAINLNQLLVWQVMTLVTSTTQATSVSYDYANFNRDTQVVVVYPVNGRFDTNVGSANGTEVKSQSHTFLANVTVSNTKVSTTVGRITINCPQTSQASYTLTNGIAIYTLDI